MKVNLFKLGSAVWILEKILAKSFNDLGFMIE